MRIQNYKTKICIGFAIILSFAIGLAQQHQVSAAGWIGSGTQSGGIPASGGGGGGGAIASYGHSWIYYQYTGGGHNEITFTPTGDTFGYKGLPISSECAKDGSGFWHHGYNVNPSESAPDWDTYTMIDSGKWGHYTSMPYGLVNASWFWAGDYITHNNNELGHSVGGIYRASYYGSEDGVFNDFKTAYQFINGRSYNGSQFPDDLYAFCFSDEMRNMATTFQGHTTINVADGAKTVKSGWDKFNSDTYETDSASVNLTFTHKLKRTDNQNVATGVNWKLATADDGLSANKVGDNNDQIMNFATNERNGSTKDATTTTYTVKLDPGTTRTICQGINHELEVKVSADGSRTSNQPGTRGSSKACITIKRKGSDIHNDSSAETKTSFIGESSNINKSGAHTIYFYVGNNINQPRDNQVKGGATQNYGEGEGSTPGPDDTAAANNAICNNFSSLCRNHSEVTSNNITIPDNANLVGAKICAASSSKHSVFKETRTRTKNITYVDANGNSVEETITEPYDVYTYYWQFSDVSCSPIAKRPNFRVTGGAAYSVGKITTSKSSKIDSNNSASNGLTFGSWSEYLAIAGNDIKNFGSGATLRGGSQNDNLTNNSPLTIANDSSPIGHSGISSDSFVSSIKSRFPEAGTFGNIWVHYGDTVNIGGGSNPLSIPNDNNIHIVFANHINIYNATTTVNAWLIADNTLNTCADIADLKELSSNNCNNSLTINGIAYAKNIKLRRTFGALAGAQSTDSAEIFNLPAGDYERAYTFASTQYKQPVEVYTQELAPRV